MPKSLDLTKTYPRSPKETMGGFVHLPRMIDKARAKAAGTVGEYIYPCPLDKSLLEFLEITAESFFDVVQRYEERQMIAWLMQNAKSRSKEEIARWNQEMLNRKPQTEESLKYFQETRDRVAPQRKDVTTWVDLLDLEEGRPVPQSV